MTHLRIEQSTSGNEYVTSDIIHKLYETAKGILDEEALNEVEESQVSLQGSLVVPKAYGDEIDWLEAKFPDLHITAGARYIRFADSEVLRVLLANNIGDGTGVTEADASAVTYIDGLFFGNTTVTSFNELRYFTGGVLLLNRAFLNTSNLQSIDLSTVSFLSERCFRSSGITGVINLPNITSMQPLVFDNCKNITEINFGPLLTSMANSTCSGCSNLQKVTGLSNKTTVPDGMFSDCLKLSNIDINFSKVTNIGDAAFQNCKLLTNLDLSDVVSIGNVAFNGCTGLTTVDISSCTSIGRSAFLNCTSLTSVDLSNCTTIGSNAFNGCTLLTSVDLSNCSSLPGYPGNAFSNCTSLTTVTGLSNIPDMGYGTFRGCTSLGTNLDLVLNLTTSSLSGNMFRDTKFKTVTINGANLTNIFDVTGGNVYPGVCFMNSCIKMDFSNTKLTNIGALTGCTSLNTVIYPSTVTNLYWNFTTGNGNATYIVLLATTPPSIGELTYFSFANSDCHIYVPDSSLSTYLTTDKWSGDKLLNRLKGISELPTSVTWVTKQSS